ncbi:MAG: class I SAM-dependent methyltransferase [Clostridiales bacterium]|nr:class I SAM-dependent methyltransferase [Clostridiales bacterium]
MNDLGEYYLRLAAAYVRGAALLNRAGGCEGDGSSPAQAEQPLTIPAHLLETPLDELPAHDCRALLTLGRAAGLRLHPFKKSHGDLPRVRAVLGFLHGVSFDTLLDVGSGRGAFLWPLLADFPKARVTSLDILAPRIACLTAVRAGGVESLQPIRADIRYFLAQPGCFDVVTLLEVLEHIPDVAVALSAAARLARRYVVVSVPSRPDENPEHLHLLTRERLTALFETAGPFRLRFDAVRDHLLLIATREG